MPNVSISPLFNETQYFDNDGNPLSGGKIFQYEAGSFTTQQTTYNSEVGDTANPNPIILDSSGRTTAGLYLVDGSAYNLVLTMPDGTTILKSNDNVVGVQPSQQIIPTATVWNIVAETPTYVNPTQFLIPGVNYTVQFAVGNRVRVTYTNSTTSFGTVGAVSFTSGNTYVVLLLDSGNLLTNISNVAWSSLVTTGITVDSGAVTYKSALSYPAGTIGNQVNSNFTSLTNSIIGQANRITRNASVFTSDYTGSYAYTLSLSPVAAASLTDPQVLTVVFIRGNGGNASTLNINGLGAYPILQYATNGTLVNAVISGFQATMLYFNGSGYVLLNQPPKADPIVPRGANSFVSNGTFVVPANVYFIKVTCVGGGGGAWGSGPNGGTHGGGGSTGVSYLSVLPGQTYPVTIGLGGSAFPSGTGQGGNTTFGVNLVIGVGANQSLGATTGVGGVVYAGGNGSLYGAGVGYGGSTFGGGQWPGGYGCGGVASGIEFAYSYTAGMSGWCLVEW